MKKTFLFLLVFGGLSLSAQNKKDNVDAKKAEAIISFLASDEMKGRRIYSPEIDKAAEFIAGHFKSAGLQTFNNSTSYLQPFSILSPTHSEIKASLNDKDLQAERIIAVTGKEKLELTEKSGYKISEIRGDENLFRTAYRFVQSGTNNIVLVDSAHHENFKRLTALKRNLMAPRGSTVFILGKQKMEHFRIEASHQFKENKLSNVVGVLPGKSKPEEYVIFSAHYDHIGIGRPENGDSIYNGANDNASGTTTIMLLADYFAKQKNNERTIIFVAFTAEESGGFGSTYFSRQLPPEKIVALLNIEMVGTESKWGKNSAYITGFEKSDLGNILQKNIKDGNFKFNPDPYPDQQLFYRSDNTVFANSGVPAHTISTAKMDNEPFYHKPGDEVKTLDIKNLAAIAKAIGLASESIIQGKDTPTRIMENDRR